MEKKGFTLIETFAGAIIFLLVTAGMLGVFTYARNYVRHSKERVVSANIARSIIEDRYNDVRQDTWDTGRLRENLAEDGNVNIDGINYGTNIAVAPVTGRDYRQATITITYQTYLREGE